MRAPWYQLEENQNNQTILKHNWKQLWELKVTFEECVRHGWRKCRIEPGLSINSGKYGFALGCIYTT